MATNLMYIIYNSDGSIKEKSFPSYVNQGSSGVNKVFVAVDGYNNESLSVSGVFKLPNRDVSSVAFVDDEETINGEAVSGKSYNLTEAQTYYNGILLLSINAFLNDNSNLFTYTAKITINETTYQAETDDSKITNGQYNSLVAALNGKEAKYSTYTIRFYGTLTDLTNDLDNINEGQISAVLTDTERLNHYQKVNGELVLIDYPEFAGAQILEQRVSDIEIDLDTKLDKYSGSASSGRRVYSNYNNVNGTIEALTGATASTLVYRDAYGRAKVQDPSANLDIANKEYVDNALPTMTIVGTMSLVGGISFGSLSVVTSPDTTITWTKPTFLVCADSNQGCAFYVGTVNSNPQFYGALSVSGTPVWFNIYQLK